MAQIDGLRYMEGAEGVHGPWPSPASTPSFGRIYDHEEEHGHHHGKSKSVLSKVKDAAKKLKHSLSKKRHGHDAADDNHYTRNWGIVLDENDDAAPTVEFRGPPAVLFEPMPAVPEILNEAATLQTATIPKEEEEEAVSAAAAALPADADKKKTLEHVDSFKEKDLPEQAIPPPQGDVDVDGDKHVSEEAKENPAEPAEAEEDNSKTLAETVTEILSPAYAAVTEATRNMASKITSPRMSGQDREAMTKQMWDKGISVKEYLLQKLEPGEDEKALSEVITEAMSPKKKSGGAPGGTAEGGVVEMVRGAVTSLLGSKEKPANGPPFTGSEIPYVNTAVSKEVRPVLTYSKSQSLPISTSPQVIHVSQTRSSSMPNTPHAPATSAFAPRNSFQKAPIEGVIKEEQLNQSNRKMLQSYLH